MTAKTRKQQLQEMLAEDPQDPFLHYGLAMEHLSEGADTEGVRCLRDLFAVAPDYVPAYLQAGKALARLGQSDEARHILQQGITVARQQGDQHAAEEMQGFLISLT
jgi:Flp pilus assembly protein TadD